MSNLQMLLKNQASWNSRWWTELKLWHDYIAVFASHLATLLSNANAKKESTAPCISSGELVKDTKVRSNKGIFCGLVVATDETNDVTIRVYDGSKKVIPTMIVDGAENFTSFHIPVKLVTNCVAKVSGIGRKFMITHKDRSYN